MRLAIDASAAASGGGITYLQHVLPRLAAHPQIDLGPILVRESITERIGPVTQGICLISGRGRFSALDSTWTRAASMRTADVIFVPTEIFFGTYDQPVVSMVRNPCLLPEALNEYGSRLRAKFYLQRQLARTSAKGARLTIAVSKHAARIAGSALRYQPERIRLIYHGGPSRQLPIRAHSGRRLLIVSNLYRYKNVHRVLQALQGMSPDVLLEVVGQPIEPEYYEELCALRESLRLEQRVDFIGHLGREAIEAAYLRASCFVWPSYAETFGHPLVEAHSYGLPIAASACAVSHEIAGRAANYFNPLDIDDIRGCLDRAVAGELLTGPLARTYSWDRCATETAAVLLEAAGR